METPHNEPKLELKKEASLDLLVYFFISHRPEITLKDEKCIVIMAYDLETAMIRAGIETQKTGIENLKIFYTGQKVNISDLISKLHLEGIVAPQSTEEKLPEIPKEEMTKQQFIYNILLAADQFIQDPEKRKQLKDLLKEIKVGKNN